MRSIIWPVLGLVSALSITACGEEKKSKSSDRDDDDGSSESEEKAREPVQTTQILEQFDDQIEVSFALPAGWEKDPDWTFQTIYKPKKAEGFNHPTIELDSDCNGMCDPRMIPDQIDEAIAEFKANAIRPNLNSGDPELDAIRGEIEIIQEGEISNGKLIAVRITYSEEVKESGPYEEMMELRCYIHPEGQNFFIELNGEAKLDQEQALLKPMIAACESIEAKVLEASEQDQ